MYITYTESILPVIIDTIGVTSISLPKVEVIKEVSVLISNNLTLFDSSTQKSDEKIVPFILGKAVDTTGAGDLYAGAFLKGYADGLKPELSAKIGSICAGQIVTQLGSRSNTDLLNLINSHLEA